MPNKYTINRSDGRWNLYLILLVMLHFSIISFSSILRIITYKSSFDLAVFEQTFWSLLHTGIPTVTTQPPFEKLNDFGWHFSPIFYLFLPIYWLVQSPFTLQIIQCLCLSGAAIPIALALKKTSLQNNIILVLIASLLFNPFYFNAAIWEFHEASIACPIIACAYLALLARNKLWFVILLFLLLLVKEHFGLSVAGFGLLWWYRNKEMKFGLSVAIGGVVALIAILFVIMPYLNNGVGHIMFQAAQGENSSARYSWLSGNLGQIAHGFIQIFFLEDDKPSALYLLILLASGAFFPILALVFMLPAMADLSAIMLSSNSMQRYLASYHSCSLIPIIIMASAIGIEKYQTYTGKILPAKHLLLLLMICIFPLYSSNALNTAYRLLDSAPIINFAVVDKIETLIADEPITVQPNIGFLFADRAEIYPFPEKLEKSKFVILYNHHPYKNSEHNPFNSIYATSPDKHYKLVAELIQNKQWNIILDEGNFLLLRAKNDK